MMQSRESPALATGSPGGGGGSGRPFDDIPREMVDWIMVSHDAKQALSPTRLRPSLNEIADQAKILCPEGEMWGRDKAHRARAFALGDAAAPEDHAAVARMQEAIHG
jgi:hypothetical protein